MKNPPDKESVHDFVRSSVEDMRKQLQDWGLGNGWEIDYEKGVATVSWTDPITESELLDQMAEALRGVHHGGLGTREDADHRNHLLSRWVRLRSDI